MVTRYKERGIKKVLFSEKSYKVLNSVEKNGFSLEISRREDITYSHIAKIVKKLADSELIEEKKVGRIKELILTHKGRKVLYNLNQIMEVLDGDM